MDDELFEFQAPAEAAPELVLGKKKKKKKKQKEEPAPVPDVSAQSDPVEASGLELADEGETADADFLKGKKKKKKKKLVLDEVSELNGDGDDAAPDDSNDAPPADDAVVPDDELPSPLLGKKKKKKKKPLQLSDLGGDVDFVPAPDAEQEEESQPAPDLEPEPEPEQRRPMTAAEKKKAKKERERLAKLEKSKKEKDDLDAILAELGEGPDASKQSETIASAAGGADNSESAGAADSEAAPAVPMTAAQKKRAKKKKKAAAEKADDDVDALLAELTGEPEKPKADETPAPAAGDVDDLLAELAGDTNAPSAAAKKKAKKKKKKAGAKADDDATETTETTESAEPTASAESKKPKKKESAAVRKMREQREKMLAEEERLRKEREEEEARIRAEEERKIAEAKRKEEEKARKKAAEKAKRERKRAEGTLLSKSEREKRRKAEAFRKQLEASGMIPAASSTNKDEGGEASSSKLSGNRKRKPNKSKPADEDEAGEKSVDGDEQAKKPEDIPDKAPTAESAAAPVEEVVPDDWDAEEEAPEDTNNIETESRDANANGTQSHGKAEDDEGSDEDDGDDDDSEEDEDSDYEGMSKTEIAAEKRMDALRRERAKEREEAMASRTKDHLRSPVICILGHVDTGKTKILDKIRRTNVQDGEAGGITQQIGATYFPIDAVKKEATKLQEGRELSYNVPSLLIIDTPGHESFTNLRSRGSSLCDIAILVVDIMHGLEPQTRESIDLLKLRKTPFIVALNKIDRIYDWKPTPHNCPTRDTLEKQPKHARDEFMRRVRETKLEFAEIGFNTELYWENDDVRKTVSLVPTSAISGEGIPDLLMLLLALPQKLLTDRLMFNPLLEATVLEVKVIEGLGTTIDIILTGGVIREGETIMVVGLDGPITATIRALLTPHPMKEMRVKGQYLHHKEIKAAQGVKISAEGLEKAVAGTQLMVVKDPNNEDELEYVREEVMKDFQTILTNVDRSGLGVYVQASTLGSLEALLEFLRTSKIPVSGINIGPVHKRDVTKASTMLERRKEYATILAFDVPVEREARELAESEGVKIMTAEIIYHLFDQFTAYMEEMKKQRREQVNGDVVFPSISKILPQHVYNKKDPIVVGVDVLEGILRVGTPLVVKNGDTWLDVGRVASIELNKKNVITARKGESVAVKIQHKTTEHIMYGRHFDFTHQLVSKMSRPAIELLKESFRDDLETEDWRLVVKLKKMFDII